MIAFNITVKLLHQSYRLRHLLVPLVLSSFIVIYDAFIKLAHSQKLRVVGGHGRLIQLVHEIGQSRYVANLLHPLDERGAVVHILVIHRALVELQRVEIAPTLEAEVALHAVQPMLGQAAPAALVLNVALVAAVGADRVVGCLRVVAHGVDRADAVGRGGGQAAAHALKGQRQHQNQHPVHIYQKKSIVRKMLFSHFHYFDFSHFKTFTTLRLPRKAILTHMAWRGATALPSSRKA